MSSFPEPDLEVVGRKQIEGFTTSEIEKVAPNVGDASITSESTTTADKDASITYESLRAGQVAATDTSQANTSKETNKSIGEDMYSKRQSRRYCRKNKENAEAIKVFQGLKERLEGQVTFPDDAYLIREGYLKKYSGDKESNYYFILTDQSLLYCNERTKLFGGKILEHRCTLPLTATLVEKQPSEYMLQIFSKVKSFYVANTSVDDVSNWYDDISTAARMAKEKEGITLKVENCALLKKSRENIRSCECCAAQFGVFTAMHHCRNCSKVVCVECSRQKARIPSIDERTLFKVCNGCANSLKNYRSYRISDGKVFN